MERCSSHPPLGSHTCRTPHNSFPPSFTLGLIPTLAIMLIFFHGIHPQTSRDLLLALIPNPKMLIFLTAHGKGFILLTCSPLARLVMHSETKAALMGGGQGEIHSCPREALAGGERATLLTPRRAQDNVPLPAGSPSEPVGGGTQPKSGLRRDEGRNSMGSRSWRWDRGSGEHLWRLNLPSDGPQWGCEYKEDECWSQTGTAPTWAWWEKEDRGPSAAASRSGAPTASPPPGRDTPASSQLSRKKTQS